MDPQNDQKRASKEQNIDTEEERNAMKNKRDDDEMQTDPLMMCEEGTARKIRTAGEVLNRI